VTPKILTAPFAVCTDGSVIVNVSCQSDDAEPERLLELALRDGTPVFIGSRLRPAEVRDVLHRRLDDAAVEAAGLGLGVPMVLGEEEREEGEDEAAEPVDELPDPQHPVHAWQAEGSHGGRARW
jgi:hypothetical protein